MHQGAVFHPCWRDAMSKLAKSLFAAALVMGALLFGPAPSAVAHTGHRPHVELLVTVLDGQQEIGPAGPGAGDPDGKGLFIALAFPDASPPTLCYLLAQTRIGTPILSHLHMAPAGTNGAIVVNLTPPVNGVSTDCISEGEVVNGMPAFPGTTVAAIVANPAGFYANIHTADFPAGAIRGQLKGF